MNGPLYTTDILRLAASLPLETTMPDPHGRGERRSRACGSVVVTEVALGPDRRLAQIAQQVQACAFGQASAALVQGFAVGRAAEELMEARAQLAGWLSGAEEAPAGFARLEPARSKTGRHGAMLLPFDALIAAVEEAASRHSRAGGSPALEPSTTSGGREMDPRLRGDDEVLGGDATP